MALSPLDAIAKHLLIQYKGQTELADNPDEVPLEGLRGATHGAFLADAKSEVNEWNFESVIADPLTGGFEERKGLLAVVKNGQKKLSNERGVTCRRCHSIMHQYAPNCYECKDCGNGSGGCGM